MATANQNKSNAAKNTNKNAPEAPKGPAATNVPGQGPEANGSTSPAAGDASAAGNLPPAGGEAPLAEDEVIVTVPKAYKLRLSHDAVHDIHPGTQRMARHLAEHWYSKAQGVEIFEEK